MKLDHKDFLCILKVEDMPIEQRRKRHRHCSTYRERCDETANQGMALRAHSMVSVTVNDTSICLLVWRLNASKL